MLFDRPSYSLRAALLGAVALAALGGVAVETSVAPVSAAATTAEAPGVESGEWSIAGKPLRPQPLPATPLTRSVLADGLMGGRTFDEFGSVVFDYADERLVLGAG